MPFTRQELIDTASRIYASRDYKGRPLDVETAVEEAVELLERIDREMTQRQETPQTHG